METNVANLNLSDLSLLYVLLAVLILLALIAAIGAWARGGGIKREDAESLFSEQGERSRKEVERLEQLLEEARKAADEAQLASRDAQDRASQEISARLQAVDEQVMQSRNSLEEVVSRAQTEYTETLSEELELVARKLAETDRRVSDKLVEMSGALGQIEDRVNQAGESIRHALIEMTRQQQEQKAQSTIQLCEALISSLGTLKSTIAHQLEENREPNAMATEASVIDDESDKIGFDTAFGGADNSGINLNQKEDSDAGTGEDSSNFTTSESQASADFAAENEEGQTSYNPETTAENFSSEPKDEEASGENDENPSEGSVEKTAFNFGSALADAGEEAASPQKADDDDEDGDKQAGWG